MKYKLKRKYRAQNVRINDNGYRNDLPKFKEFRKYGIVNGEKYLPKSKEASERFENCILVDGCYLIPNEYLEKKSGNDRPIVEEATKMDSSSWSKELKDNATYYRSGAIIGAMSGGLVAIYFKKSMWKWGIAGALAGAYIGYQIGEARNYGKKPIFIKIKK